jgi:hypothetical protein
MNTKNLETLDLAQLSTVAGGHGEGTACAVGALAGAMFGSPAGVPGAVVGGAAGCLVGVGLNALGHRHR